MAGVIVLLLLVLPFVELAVFIGAVDVVGLLPAVIAIIGVGIAGGVLVKQQGLGIWRRAEGKLRAGDAPSAEVVNGLLILAAGVLLVLPGFLSDLLAILILLPPTRALVRRALFRRFERQVEATLAGPLGTAFGVSSRPRVRVHTGTATYDVREVHEVERASSTRPGAAAEGVGRPGAGPR